MARMIDADKFIEYLGLDAENSREENLGEIVTLEDFDRQPTVDAEPVRRGKWIARKQNKKDPRTAIDICSCCRFPVAHFLRSNFEYCPNCGAKMEEKRQNV